jgi:hypothetical protein
LHSSTASCQATISSSNQPRRLALAGDCWILRFRGMAAVVEQAFRVGNRGAGSPRCFLPSRPGSVSTPTGCDKITRRAEFSFRRRANHLQESSHPVPEEGALAIVTERWDGMRWTRRHRARDGIAGRDKIRERSQDVPTSGAEAYGKVVWFRCLSGWRQVFRRRASPTGPECQFPAGDGGRKARYSGKSAI